MMNTPNEAAQPMTAANRLSIPLKERKWMYAALLLSAVFVIWGLRDMLQLPLSILQSKRFEFTIKNYGSYARIALFIVLANYVLGAALRKRWINRRDDVKKWTASLWRLARKLHTPAAIVAIGFIALHAIAVFIHGFQADFHSISGLLALFVLLPVPISGLFRYRKLDRKWHLRFGLAFAVCFLIHAFV
ncbi:hypothetical protein [Paenibacillus piri]|uniref:Ferric oxidoreductase domain-containing protein n=1 Tax=Paenibacillus piri TaxID=2547395 RepID=A0A4R5KGF5_9BACL|nr:hypothetical protein [Paenibacillus piri]TDF94102.1 hypothetical protein E1757_24735 [Paenibacillus piri]